ncbi:MAG TPA: methylglyoxal synthase [Tissierellaceae bacterium]|nr:methylglyoxal synthase [Tissierellaceae bacterium]
MNNTDWSLGSQKTIALVAHDNMKKDLINWVKRQKDLLAKHILCGTGTTSKLISETTGLPVKSFKSGPLGGDQQIGARIAEGEIDFMIFFWDPLKAQPHDPDVKALLRIAVLYDIPIANNKATADFLILSPLMDKTYDRHIVDFSELMEKRNKESFGM